MSESVEFCLNKATEEEISNHLSICDDDFVPPLSRRVAIGSYAHKIAENAMRFEAWEADVLVGSIAAYCNDSERRIAYITSVSVLRRWQGRGIASRLLELCVEYVKERGFDCIELEVDSGNVGATKLYEKNSFTLNKMTGRLATMQLNTGRDA